MFSLYQQEYLREGVCRFFLASLNVNATLGEVTSRRRKEIRTSGERQRTERRLHGNSYPTKGREGK